MVGRMDVPGRWAGGFRAWDEHGVYLATGRGVVAGPGAPGAGRRAARAGPARGSRSAGTSSRGSTAPRARSSRPRGSASRWSRSARSPPAWRTRSTTRRRPRRGPSTRSTARARRCSRRSAGSPRARSRRAQFARARRAAPRDRAAAGRSWTRWTWPTARRRCRVVARPATASSATGSIAPPLAAAGVDVAWCERAAERARRRRRSSPAWSGWPARSSVADAARRGEGVDAAHLRTGRRRAGRTRRWTARRSSASTSPTGSRARW